MSKQPRTAPERALLEREALRQVIRLERQRVDCDDKCDAFMVPQTPDEYRAAYEHWVTHSYLAGCSHGC